MYIDYFKLAKKPFLLSPSAAVFYECPGIKNCYNKLLDGIRSDHGLILLTGERGSGKSLFSQKLEADLAADQHYRCISLPFTSLQLDEMLEYICAQLNLSIGLARNEDALEILDMFLTNGVSPIKSIVLIIDEAENLSAEILNGLTMLIDMSLNAERAVQIVLLARNEEGLNLDRPELSSFKKMISLRCNIPPLTADEVSGYIEYQLQEAGAKQTGLFTEQAGREVFKHTKGNPRAINLLCDQTLALSVKDEVTSITPERVDDVQHRIDFQDTLETHTSQVSEAIAQYSNDNHELPDDFLDPDTVPEPESRDDLLNTLEAQPVLQNVPPEPDPADVATIETHRTNRARNHPEASTEKSRVLIHDRRSALPDKTGKLGILLVIASLAVLTIVGLLFLQLQSQKDTIRGLEEKLVSITDQPALVSEDGGVQIREPQPSLPETPLPVVEVEEIIPHEEITKTIASEINTAKTEANPEPELKLESTTEPAQKKEAFTEKSSAEPETLIEESITNEPSPEADEIKMLFDKASKQIEANNLTEPLNDNAIATYRDILKLEPDNEPAQQGITKIKEDFVSWAKKSEQRDDLEKARIQYGKALEIDPDDAALVKKIAEMDNKSATRQSGETLTIVLEYARKGNTKELDELLMKGAFPDVRDKSGNSPLMLATDRGHIDTVKTLLDHGADVNLSNKIGDTALMNAIWSNHQAIAEVLLDHDAAVNATNRHGWTALMYAAIHGHTKLVSRLIKADARLEPRTRDGKTPLAAAAHNGQRGVVSLLLKQGVKIDARDNDDWTPLMHAVWNNHSTVVQLLLLNNANVNNTNRDNWTPLMLASWNGFDSIVTMLLESGADKSIQNAKGNKALDLARKQQHQNIVSQLQ